MQASAFQQLHSENVALHKHVNDLQRVIDQQQIALQQKTLEVHGEKVSNMITVLATAIPAPTRDKGPAKRWWRRFGKAVADHIFELPTTASVCVPQALIDEVANNPHRYKGEMSKDEAAGTQTFTVSKRSAAEIVEIEARLEAQRAAIEQAQKEAAEQAATPPIVGLDGQTPARQTAGKILTVAR